MSILVVNSEVIRVITEPQNNITSPDIGGPIKYKSLTCIGCRANKRRFSVRVGGYPSQRLRFMGTMLLLCAGIIIGYTISWSSSRGSLRKFLSNIEVLLRSNSEYLRVAVHSLFSLSCLFICPTVLTHCKLGGGWSPCCHATPDYSYPTPPSGLFLQPQTQPQTVCMQPLGPKHLLRYFRPWFGEAEFTPLCASNKGDTRRLVTLFTGVKYEPTPGSVEDIFKVRGWRDKEAFYIRNPSPSQHHL